MTQRKYFWGRSVSVRNFLTGVQPAVTDLSDLGAAEKSCEHSTFISFPLKLIWVYKSHSDRHPYSPDYQEKN